MKKILLIDDEPDILSIVRVCLERFAGWQVSSALSGAEGIAKAQLESPDGILLDVSMPDMDGIQVWAQLQGDPTTVSIPVIFLTAKVLPRDTDIFASLGVSGVINKPFDPLLLWREVAGIFHWD